MLEGSRLTETCLSESQDILNEHEVELAVVLMPTAELVYAPLEHGNLSDSYSKLVGAETAARDALITFLENENIPYIDLLIPPDEAAQGNKVFFPSIDGHLTVEGNQLMAEYFAKNWVILQL